MIAFHIGATDQGQDMFGANGNTKSAAFATILAKVRWIAMVQFSFLLTPKAFSYINAKEKQGIQRAWPLLPNEPGRHGTQSGLWI